MALIPVKYYKEFDIDFYLNYFGSPHILYVSQEDIVIGVIVHSIRSGWSKKLYS